MEQTLRHCKLNGGAVGGGGTPQPIPLPTGPNYTNVKPAQIAADYSTNNGWLGLLTDFLKPKAEG